MKTFIPIDLTAVNQDMNKEKSNTKPKLLKYEEQKYEEVTPSENQPAKTAAEKETFRTLSVPLKSEGTEEPKDHDVIRHIVRLREKFGWQTILSQHNLECKSSKIPAWKIILKNPLKDDGEFVYCLPQKNPKVPYNPYDLQVVSAHRARHCKEFWIVNTSFISKNIKIGGVEEIVLVPTLE
ncbi:dynein axonemal heavy chain 14 [Manis pentadactyla]|uniref:dynein axonemal heavy chain 14 n=1 Tax=Manis pentadactyla TaxID=143292 RepID=UPI00255D02D3|nr:dynein axonemal heavy chain 14 [Manis pentadactyla]